MDIFRALSSARRVITEAVLDCVITPETPEGVLGRSLAASETAEEAQTRLRVYFHGKYGFEEGERRLPLYWEKAKHLWAIHSSTSAPVSGSYTLSKDEEGYYLVHLSGELLPLEEIAYAGQDGLEFPLDDEGGIAVVDVEHRQIWFR